MKRIYGHYAGRRYYQTQRLLEWVRCSVIDAKGEYGFIANTDIPIKPDANKRLEDLSI